MHDIYDGSHGQAGAGRYHCWLCREDCGTETHQMKVDYAENNAITDDVAGHAYVEQFGQETFQRADNTMNANKVSRYGLFTRHGIVGG